MFSLALILGLLVPVAGTVLGASGVFLIKDHIPDRAQKSLLGFASGVMVAASVWSLIIPAMEMTPEEGANSIMRVVPAAVGVALGFLALLLIDRFTPHIHIDNRPEGPSAKNLSRTKKLALAVTIHNIPEGMAIGVTLAAAIAEGAGLISMASALTLSLGIAIQNMPEGAIVSMPLRAAGNSRSRAFIIGALSGLVEPVAAIITILLVAIVLPVLPYLLSFAAGAMLYVVVEELIPETAEGRHSNLGTIGFAAGFILMMVLDVVLG